MEAKQVSKAIAELQPECLPGLHSCSRIGGESHDPIQPQFKPGEESYRPPKEAWLMGC